MVAFRESSEQTIFGVRTSWDMKNLACFLALLIALLCAPTSTSSGHWKSYTIVDGLAGGNVHAIRQDQNGNLWFGGVTGLSLLDLQADTPNDIVMYTMEQGLVANSVRALAIDDEKSIWIGTDHCISVLHPQKNGHTFRLTNYTTTDGLTGNSVSSIIKDQNGSIWVGTDEGLSVWDGSGFQQYTEKEGLNSNRINCLYEDYQGLT